MRRLPEQIANPGLAALIHGGGFRSLERFAQIVNARGWQLHGLKLAYDHVTVKRWLAGSVCQNADVVATVVSEAWGVPVPIHVLWPELRDGAGPFRHTCRCGWPTEPSTTWGRSLGATC